MAAFPRRAGKVGDGPRIVKAGSRARSSATSPQGEGPQAGGRCGDDCRQNGNPRFPAPGGRLFCRLDPVVPVPLRFAVAVVVTGGGLEARPRIGSFHEREDPASNRSFSRNQPAIGARPGTCVGTKKNPARTIRTGLGKSMGRRPTSSSGPRALPGLPGNGARGGADSLLALRCSSRRRKRARRRTNRRQR